MYITLTKRLPTLKIQYHSQQLFLQGHFVKHLTSTILTSMLFLFVYLFRFPYSTCIIPYYESLLGLSSFLNGLHFEHKLKIIHSIEDLIIFILEDLIIYLENNGSMFSSFLCIQFRKGLDISTRKLRMPRGRTLIPRSFYFLNYSPLPRINYLFL